MRTKLFFFGVVIFLFSGIFQVNGQEKFFFPDSTSFFEFLTNQEQVPGLKYRLVIPAGFEKPSDDKIQWEQREFGVWQTSPLDSISHFLRIKTEISPRISSSMRIDFLIYDEPATAEAAMEFVSALLRSNDIFPVANEKIADEDLVIVAQESSFEPGIFLGFGYFSDFKVFMITLIITVFFILAGGMILFMVIFKSRRNRREFLKKEYAKVISQKLTEVIFTYSLDELKEISNEELEQYFQASQLSNTLFTEVLIDHILSLNKKMKGEFKDKLKTLFRLLKLDQVAAANTKAKRWDTIVNGLVQINEMDLVEHLPFVKNHLNSPNFHIRTNATATLLNLSEEVNLSFLKDQKFPLSNWQQMNYLRIIKQLYPNRKLLMDTLFDSENLSVRLFGYKLVRMIGRVDLVENLRNIAINATAEEKIEILKTVETLWVTGYTGLIHIAMQSSDSKLAKQAIRMAGNMGNAESQLIILELLASNKIFEIRKELLRSLRRLNQQAFEDYIHTSLDKYDHAIYSHLEDPLISHV